MKNKKRDTNKIIVNKILKYCGQITESMNRFDNSYEKYVNDFVFQYSVNMCIFQIGELTTRLTEDFKEKHNIIPWKLIRAMRNITAHEYEKLEFEAMWQTLTEDIPALEKQLQEILKIENDEEN